jgi:two-component system sensor histidine kinase TctE
MGRPASLRTRLVWGVALPLVLTWSVGTGVALWIASRYVHQAYDRALLDDAYAVAAQVESGPEGPQLTLSQQEMAALLFDQTEQEFFVVRSLGGQFLAGHGSVPQAPLPALGHVFHDDSIHGRAVRMVSLRRKASDTFVVVMAQTIGGRRALLRELVLYSAAAQAVLLALLVVWLRSGIGRQLRPLARLEDAVDQRDADDLSPLPAPLAAAAPTRDIARLGHSINSLLARLRDSLAAQREFSGNVAHELRTPLAGIRAQAEYALSQDDPAQWRAQLQGILRSQARASHCVDQLLALARADEARAALQLKAVPLHDLAREVLLRWLPRADAAGADLGASGLDTPVWVRADALLLEGVLDNLIDNALRYATTGAAPRITLLLWAQGDAATLEVQDNGPGMPPDERALALARGVQGADGRALGQGAGLGLAIVQRYAQLLDAHFELDATPGGGLAARFTLPLTQPAGAGAMG